MRKIDFNKTMNRNRGHGSIIFTLTDNKKSWQGLQDDYRTYCGVISFSEEGQGDA